MRLTYIHNAEIPSRGASTVQVMRMCSAFTRLGCDVELIVPHSGEGPALSAAESLAYYGCTDSFAIHRIALGKAAWIGFAWMAAKRAAARGSDLVYGRCVRSCLASGWRGLPVMHEAHGPMEAYSSSGRIAIRALARSSRLARLVVINQALAAYYARALPALARPPIVSPSGTDPVPGTRPRQGADGARLRVGYVGSLFPGKGMEMIAEIAKQSDHELVVVGGDEGQIAHWKAQTGDRVTFLGFMPNSQVADEIARLDIALAPYGVSVTGAGTSFDLAKWMSPLKLFEYMAHARAIIASDLPAIREVVENGREAVLCPPDDPDAWARAIDDLAADAGKRQRLGQTALDALLCGFTWETRAANILSAYRTE